MADNKKYYYLKLKDNFFESEELVILQSMPDGYIYSDILMKLYLKSLKSEGRLMFKEHIPYNPTMLATVVRHPVALVEKALTLFKDLGLVDVLDNGAIFMLDIQNFVGQSSTEGDRKRKYRKEIEAEKQLLGQMSGQTSDKRPPENRDKSIENRDKSLKEKKDKKKKPADADFTSLFSSYTTNQELIETLNDFVAMRIEIKEPATERAMKSILTKLNQLAQNDEEKIQILENAIVGNWKGVWPLNHQQRGNTDAKPIRTIGEVDSTGRQYL